MAGHHERVIESCTSPLTKSEIDRRMRDVAAHVAAGALCANGSPRWIAASELVERVRPFVGLN